MKFYVGASTNDLRGVGVAARLAGRVLLAFEPGVQAKVERLTGRRPTVPGPDKGPRASFERRETLLRDYPLERRVAAGRLSWQRRDRA